MRDLDASDRQGWRRVRCVGGVYPEDRDCEDLFTRDGLDPEEIHGVEDAGGVKRPQR